MFLPHEISKIKDQRRLKQRGMDEEETSFNVEGDPLDYDIAPPTDEHVSAETGGDDGENIEKNKKDETDDDDVIAIEPFNMRKEMEEGAFDTEGNYVDSNRKMTSTNRSLNRDEGDDPWITSLDEQASLASKKDDDAFYPKKPLRASQNRPDLFQVLEGTPTIDIIKKLICMLESGQTPIEALKGKKQSKKRSLPGMRKSEGKSSREGTPRDVKKSPLSTPRGLEDMTIADLAHVLTITWQNVYYMTKEDILEALAMAKNNAKSSSTSVPKRYEFKWIKGGEKVYGPSSDGEILRWIAYDYISDQNPVVLRQVGSDGMPLSEEWVGYRDSDVYTFLNDKLSALTISTTGNRQASEEENNSDSADEDDTFAKKQRKDELIGIKHKENKHVEDSPASDDDDPDIE